MPSNAGKSIALIVALLVARDSFALVFDDDLIVRTDRPYIWLDDRQDGTPGEQSWIIGVDQRLNRTFPPNGSFWIESSFERVFPFVIEDGAPTSGIYLEATGELGLGVDEPAQNVHMIGTRPAIRLEDSTTGEDDVDIVMNDDRYFLQSVTTGNFPLLVEMAAPSLSLNVAVNGNVGIGDVAASEDLELFSGNPAIRFNDTNGSNDWVLNDDNSSGVFDIANGTLGTSPFRLEALAPTATLVLDDLGYLGQGLIDPLAPLHIFRDDATQEMLILESDEAGGPQDRAMMDLSNNGGIRFQFANNTLGTAWRFQAATGNQDRFEVTKVGTGRIEFWIDDLGNGFVAGDLDVGGNLLTNVLLPSDRGLKTSIDRVDPDSVLERLASLPIAAWEYTDRPGERHMGPMAQDFRAAFGLGSDDTSISVVDASGVALASIQALEARHRAMQARIEKLEALEKENAELKARLALVEQLVMQGFPRTARNERAP